MEQTPQRSANSEFTFDPTNKVVGSIDAADDAKDAMRDLTAAGFPAHEVELLTNEEGAHRIGMSGEGHEVMVHVFDLHRKCRLSMTRPLSSGGSNKSCGPVIT